ncbi:hypothetical protein P3602_21350 [Vibrio parahaemolyticus]|uniref:hypothetical protein n=1 Tax=Vibrio TaxID=662 RepID=UPI001B82926B|nr:MULTISPECIES: hypothetical protein [Vibrio]MDF5108457.1 hypothetical protein [Vibrio parahaemolyticus]MCA2420877.1 hypothetical protein [Vibrio alginolyticus]MCA2445651.1 hypothetical protein [Vibrio alginolyticus]MDF5143362.1 hypothetical protein [Vibrio parahaemolyticus]MDF5153788.1 hypothetical protein [Vibrio parahaemolyticus]
MDLNTGTTIAIGLGLGIAMHFYFKAKKAREDKEAEDSLKTAGDKLDKPSPRTASAGKTSHAFVPPASQSARVKPTPSRSGRDYDDGDDLLATAVVGAAIMDSVEPDTTKTYSSVSVTGFDSGSSDSGSSSSFDSGGDSSCD